MVEPANGGEGLVESVNYAANQIYGGERAERQGDGEREVALVNGGAGLGEPANGAANQIYGGERAEQQQWAGQWREGSGSILSGAGMKNLGKFFCRAHLYTDSFYNAGRNRRTAVLRQTSPSVPPWTMNKQMEADTQPEPAVMFSTQPD